MNSSLRIFGIGSSHGADQVGWLVAQSLSKRGDLDVDVRVAATPLEMLDHLDGCERILIVDACVTGAEAGTVFRITWPDDRFGSEQKLSSHGLGLVETLLLAQQLGRLPDSVIVYCLEVEEHEYEPAEPVAGLADLERRVLADVIQFQGEPLELLEQPDDA